MVFIFVLHLLVARKHVKLSGFEQDLSTFSSSYSKDQHKQESMTTLPLGETFSTVHGVPLVVWSFWFNKEALTENRARNLDAMEHKLQIPVRFVTLGNLSNYLHWPVHDAVSYLSAVHKADYFRVYFCLYYGGGYADIKQMVEPWNLFFEKFKDDQVWMIGVPEVPNGVASPPNVTFPADYYKKVISNGFFISRPNNSFLKTVHEMQNQLLDRYAEELKSHPAPSDRCCFNHENGYPIGWTELLGELMAVAAMNVSEHFSRVMKMPSLEGYI